ASKGTCAAPPSGAGSRGGRHDTTDRRVVSRGGRLGGGGVRASGGDRRRTADRARRDDRGAGRALGSRGDHPPRPTGTVDPRGSSCTRTRKRKSRSASSPTWTGS